MKTHSTPNEVKDLLERQLGADVTASHNEYGGYDYRRTNGSTTVRVAHDDNEIAVYVFNRTAADRLGENIADARFRNMPAAIIAATAAAYLDNNMPAATYLDLDN